MNFKQISLVIFFIPGIGMSGCNNRDNKNIIDNIFSKISSEHNSTKLTITVAQLKELIQWT